jgi:hypothetical protein
LSQYELEALQKEMEVEAAKAQMYEAMTAKTQVIRRKDSEGNWGYVYTAAEEEIGEAVSEYEQSVYEYEKLNEEAVDEFSELILSTQTEFSEAIAEI